MLELYFENFSSWVVSYYITYMFYGDVNHILHIDCIYIYVLNLVWMWLLLMLLINVQVCYIQGCISSLVLWYGDNVLTIRLAYLNRL